MIINQLQLNSIPENLQVSPEFRLVAACSWIPRSKHAVLQKLVVESLFQSHLNWDEVSQLVLRHGVVSQFCMIMGQRAWLDVPLEIKERLKNIKKQQTVRALGQVAELSRIGRIFSSAGIDLIPLKGVFLSQELYGDPCVRSSCDIDLLIRPEDIEKTEEILMQAGYRHALGFHDMGELQRRHIIDTLHHHEYINDIKNCSIELHWRSYLWTKDKVAALWESCISSTWLNAGLSQLSGQENILFLADHGARHDWPCLKWLSDLAMLMQELTVDDWLSLKEKAVFYDLQRVVGQSVMLLEWFYGIKPPEKLRKLLLSEEIVQKLSLHAASQLTASVDDIALQLKRFVGIRQAYRIKQLKPSTSVFALISCKMMNYSDFVELPLPNCLFWLYLPLRPFFWFKRHYMKRTSS